MGERDLKKLIRLLGTVREMIVEERLHARRTKKNPNNTSRDTVDLLLTDLVRYSPKFVDRTIAFARAATGERNANE